MEKLDGRGFLKMQHDKDTFDFSLKKIQYKNQAKILSQWKSENSMPAILSLAYLAPVEYYKVLANSSEIFIEKEENYIKQTYRNRCKILTANGVMDLIIPVEKSEGNKPSIKDVKISVHSDWQKQHWRAIVSAYSSSPFFEYYEDDLYPFFKKKWLFLWDFNLEIQNKIIELLDLETQINFTEKFEPFPADKRIDLREEFHPKRQSKIEYSPYYQVFRGKFGFVKGLSVIDLLFNMGNESQLILSEK